MEQGGRMPGSCEESDSQCASGKEMGSEGDFAIYESVSAGRYLCKVCGTGIGAVSCKTLGGRKMLFLPDWNG